MFCGLYNNTKKNMNTFYLWENAVLCLENKVVFLGIYSCIWRKTVVFDLIIVTFGANAVVFGVNSVVLGIINSYLRQIQPYF